MHGVYRAALCLVVLSLFFSFALSAADASDDAAFVIHYPSPPAGSLVASSTTNETLNAVSWKPGSRYAIIAGDRVVLKCMDEKIYKVDIGPNNLAGVAFEWKAIAWRPQQPLARNNFALMVGNRGSIYRYDGSNVTNVSVPDLDITHGTPATLRGVAWKPDGSYALIVGDEGFIYAFDPSRTDNEMTRFNFLQNKDAYLSSVAWKPDGSYAIIVGNKGTVIKFDDAGKTFTNLSSGLELAGREAQAQDLLDVAWSPDGDYALIVGTHETILKYDGVSFTTKSSGQDRFSVLRKIAWKPDERPDISGYQGTALIVGDNGIALEYNESKATQFRALSLQINSNLNGAAWDLEGRYAVIAGSGGIVLRYPNERPLATLSASSIAGAEGQEITFYASESYDPDGNATGMRYKFDYGNGENSGWLDAPEVSYTYQSNGKYNATLAVQDARDAYSTNAASIPIIIGRTNTANRAPTANAGHDMTARSGATVQFFAEGSDTDGRIVYYQWDFDGDGKYDWNSTTTGNAPHIYTQNKTYRAVLRVIDDDGGSAMDSVIVEVGQRSALFLPGADAVAACIAVLVASFVMTCMTRGEGG